MNVTFDKIFYENPEIKQINSPTGRKYLYDGKEYTSVTTFLSQTKSEASKKALENWKERVGEVEASKITKKAANRGSILHKNIENYFLNEELIFSNPLDRFRYINISKHLKNIEKIYKLEGRMYSKKLNLAGTVDCVAEYNGKLSIIDFKTSTVPKKEEWIEDYFIQETIYSLMFAEMYDKKVEQIVTLFAYDDQSPSEEIIKKPSEYLEKLINRLKLWKGK